MCTSYRRYCYCSRYVSPTTQYNHSLSLSSSG
nr:MAG TPA: hypothetical protein [Caudoviricetes sp.]